MSASPSPFSIDDVFTAGIGLDFAGAFLLARGLLATPAEILRRAQHYYDLSPVAVATHVRDRIDAMFGIGLLLAGFALQALGYSLVLLGIGSDARGVDRALVGGGFAIVTMLASLLSWRLSRRRLARRAVIELAHFTRSGERQELPSARDLLSYGQELGFGGMTRDEVTRPGGTARYANRVFGVAHVREELEHPASSDPEA